ncbi:MAG: hypothetical protein IJC16_00755 [Rikenellaceae bacterium]|nr:hypothetical protein [Rikenellaceae bacterium]
MKKIGMLLALVCGALIACNQDANTSGGKYLIAEEMYTQVGTQNAIGLDPMNVAMRLNTLLIEAEKQGITDLNTAVKIPVDDGSTRLDITKRLFGRTEFKEPSPGVYSLKYPINYKPTIGVDNIRYGTLIITTGGKYLNDLGPGEKWTVTAGDDFKSESLLKIEYPNYEITRVQNNQWKFSFTDCTVYWTSLSENVGSDWNGEYVVTQVSGNQEYFAVRNSDFILDGESWGRTAFYTDDFKFEVTTPIQTRYATCGYRLYVTGEEKITLDDADRKYPTVYAGYRLDGGADCSYFIDLTYEGVTGTIKVDLGDSSTDTTED